MNHWCTKQILHLVPSQNLYIWFCNISSLLPEIWYRRRTGTTSSALHYIILKYFTINLMDGTKCKTCFGCPRIVLCGPWKTLFSKIEFGSGWPPPWFGESPDFLLDIFCETFPKKIPEHFLLNLIATVLNDPLHLLVHKLDTAQARLL